MTVISQLQNNKKDLNQVRVVTQPMPELKPGEALLRISRLSYALLSLLRHQSRRPVWIFHTPSPKHHRASASGPCLPT